MEKDIITLGKYLITSGVDRPMNLQKILFFLRYEELKNEGHTPKSYFEKNCNFEARVWGPTNYKSFFFFQDVFNQQDEKENFLLNKSEYKKVDKVYGKWLKEYIEKSGEELAFKSRQNKSWIKARG